MLATFLTRSMIQRGKLWTTPSTSRQRPAPDSPRQLWIRLGGADVESECALSMPNRHGQSDHEAELADPPSQKDGQDTVPRRQSPARGVQIRCDHHR
jgi:hypothetical protein